MTRKLNTQAKREREREREGKLETVSGKQKSNFHCHLKYLHLRLGKCTFITQQTLDGKKITRAVI